MKYYTTKQMASILGVGIETLRHYENKGILKPRRDKENNYRLYTASDIRKFNSCRIFRTFDFTIEEAAKIIEWESLDYIKDSVDYKIEALKKQRVFLDERINSLEAYKKKVQDAEDLNGRLVIKEMPDVYYFTTQRFDQYETDHKNDSLRKRWVEYFPVAQWARRVKASKIKYMYEELPYDNGIIIEADVARKINFPQELIESAEKIEGGRICYTVFGKFDNEPYDWSAFQPVFRQINDAGYEICGDMITFFVTSKYKGDNLVNYHYCKIRIK
ncbi:MerR family transcriptional regulator [Natronincola ferrireducens]|uniref:DNA-binding transcriptional regulator, MerR family n=1 Tax=Natronincola ferrireducens TaxID=393762 RepID=A0A1G8Z678_9FIRM|nr:MerR family transcriptional regulator [Natronincola ferrireducens]SDK10582.1 DNA-binding transcriptional regulator, MerR family [Natronincola ferrireducens]